MVELMEMERPLIRIWVDADAWPGVIKEILYRAAERVQIELVLVANQSLRIPASRFIRSVQVASGFDAADDYIAEHLNAGDLVITADIPLAADVITHGGTALNPRGERYTVDNIKQRLQMRDMMDQLRSSGVETGGPSTLKQSDRQAFANQLDRFLVAVSRPS